MAYTKTVWVEGGAPGITAANLNKIEQGIADAHAHTTQTDNPHEVTSLQTNVLASHAFGSTEPGTNYPVGVTTFFVSGATGWPTLSGTVLTIYHSTYRCKQFFYNNTGGVVHEREWYDGAWSEWVKVWNSGNDGSGSGLDADLLDGNHASVFAKLSGGTFTGLMTFNEGISFPIDKGIVASGVLAIDFFGPASSGLGVAIGAGGMTIIGGGEAAQTVKDGLLTAGSTGGTEALHLASDNEIVFVPGQQSGYSSANAMRLNSNGTLNVQKHIFIDNVSDVSETADNGIVLKGVNGKLKIDDNEILSVDSNDNLKTLIVSAPDISMNGNYVYAAGHNVTWGTAAPSGGGNGDIYIQY